jgi:hypothetical protein
MAPLKAGSLKKTFWLLGYDLPSENKGGLTEHQTTFVNSQRLQVWRDLKSVFKSTPFQKSLWLIRNPEDQVKSLDNRWKPIIVTDGKELTGGALKDYMDNWKKEYLQEGFPDVNLEAWPIATNDMGEQFIRNGQVRFIFDTIMDIDERVDAFIKKGTVKVKQFNAMVGGLDWMRSVFVQDLGNQHSRYFEFDKTYMKIKDKMELRLRGMMVA